MKKLSLSGALCLLMLAACSAMPSEKPDTSPAKSANAQTRHCSGLIQGYETADYFFDAKQGQHLNISMASSAPAAYFNLLPPDGETALFNGSIRGNQFEGAAPQTGRYTVRIYQMRAAARRGGQADYRLTIILAP